MGQFVVIDGVVHEVEGAIHETREEAEALAAQATHPLDNPASEIGMAAEHVEVAAELAAVELAEEGHETEAKNLIHDVLEALADMAEELEDVAEEIADEVEATAEDTPEGTAAEAIVHEAEAEAEAAAALARKEADIPPEITHPWFRNRGRKGS